MSRGRRFKETKPKLNIKKVIAVIMALLVLMMFIVAVKTLTKKDFNNIDLKSTSYFSLYTNGKWGVIDNNAKIIIEPVYDEMIIIPDNTKDIFICTYDVDYTNNTYISKVINSKNKQLFSEYTKVYAIENYDKNNNLWYEPNILKVEQEGKFGLINFNGKIILECKYDDIYALKGTEKRLVTKIDNKYGLVDLNGKSIIENKYKNITSLGKETDMYIVQNEEENFGIADVLECKYKEIKPIASTEVFQVKDNDEYKLIDKNQNEISIGKFDEIKQVKDNIIIFKKDNKYYAYNIEDQKTLDEEYEDIIICSNKNMIVKSKDAYGIISILGELRLNIEFKNITYYSNADIYEIEKQDEDNAENTILDSGFNQIMTGIISDINTEKGYIKVWKEDGYKYYNFKGEEQPATKILTRNTIFASKKDNKYGFVNRAGEQVTDYIYDDVIEQNDYGFAAVKKDNLWGAIDKNGNLVCEIKYNLDDNLLIDFIGTYHLGKDINLMYYTDK